MSDSLEWTPQGTCAICHEPIESDGVFYRHAHADHDTYCCTGDGSVAFPDTDTGPSATDAQRIAYALRKLTQWAENYERNGARHVREHNTAAAARCAAQAVDMRDVIDMLNGSEDAYILRLASSRGE